LKLTEQTLPGSPHPNLWLLYTFWVVNILFWENFHYKGDRDVAEKTSHHFKEASCPLKMYLKSLAEIEKASICLKKFSKIVEIFIKAQHF
jgi:hypothetical protein